MKNILIMIMLVLFIFGCSLDDTSLVDKSEDDNLISDTATRAPMPDLRPYYFRSPYRAYPSQAIGSSMYLRVINSGTATAHCRDGYFFVGFYLSRNRTLDSSDTLLLGGRESVTTPMGVNQIKTVSIYSGMSIPSGTAYGTYYLLAVIDETGKISESSETNNIAYRRISIVPKKADLYGYSFSAPSSATAGQQIGADMALKVRNSGFISATAPAGYFFVGFFLSTNSTYDSSDVLLLGGRESVYTPIAVNESKDVSIYDGMSIPAGTTAGSYYLIAVVDEFDVVDEIYETNHVKRTIQITN